MKKLLIIVFILGLTPLLSKAQCWNYFTYTNGDTLTFTFSGEAYWDSINVQADTYSWNFGDGTTGEGQTITHTFEPNPLGVYIVCLTTVSVDQATGDSCIAESCQDVWVGQQQDCEAWFFYYPVDSMNTSLTYQFIDASWGWPDSWAWEFGDGTTSSEQNPIHTFPEEGTYIVTFSIWDSSGTCQSTYTEEVFIGTTPWDCFNYFYYDYEDQYTLTFTGEAIWRENIEADSYSWDFGDGTTGEGQTVSHTFESNPNDVYTVCLITVSFDPATGDTCIAESCQEVWVGQQQDCEAWFFYYPVDSMNTSLTYQFMDASWGYPDSWAWEFGDGTTSSEQNPIHTFPEEGTYVVTFSIWDSAGTCQSTYTEEVFIGTNPWECFNYFYYDYEDQYTLTFTGEAYWNGMIIEADSYSWDFGDGTTGEGQTITHTFESNPNDVYTVCLITVSVDEATGDTCIAESCQEIWIGQQQDCEAWSFYFPVDSMNSSLTYQFMDASWGYPDSWAWEFGDGTTSSEQNPIHTFPEEGSYIVTFTIWDSAGTCQSTYTEEVFIGTNPWECFNFFYYEYENTYTLTFTGEAFWRENIEADSYSWDFGDGTTGEGETITHIFEPNTNGTYTVCLTTVSFDLATGDSCIAESCQEVWISNQQGCDIWGQVFVGNAFVDIGLATLFTIESNTGEMYVTDIQPIDSAGMYFFDQVQQGTYYILTELLPASAYYEEYLPTYYGDVLFWEDASIIYTDDLANPYNVNMVAATAYGSGPGDISGTITEDGRFDGEGLPAMDINILLFDQNMNGIGYMYSTEEGTFDFSALALGTYYIYPEIPGISTTPATVILSEENLSSTVDILISEGEVSFLSTNDMDPCLINIKRIYPNPAQDIINVEFKIETSRVDIADYRLLIYDVNGRLMDEFEAIGSEGHGNIEVSVSSFPNGIYYAIISNTNQILSREKIVVIH